MTEEKAKAPHGAGGCERKGLPGRSSGPDRIREWQFTPPAVAVRAVLIAALLYPVMAIFSRRRTYGREVLNSIDGPVIFAANHLSVADNPAVLLALPWRWRLRVATAASEEVMRGRGRVQSFFAALISNGFQISQTGSIRGSMAYCGKLLRARWSLLFFPEGMRSGDGKLGPFKPGIGLLAVGLGVPVIPVHIKGADTVLPMGGSHPRRGRIEVRFGPPLRFPPGTKYADAAQTIRDAVAALPQETYSRQSAGRASPAIRADNPEREEPG